jgi:hypothetical protein
MVWVESFCAAYSVMLPIGAGSVIVNFQDALYKYITVRRRVKMWKKYLTWGLALTWFGTPLYFVVFTTAELAWLDLLVAFLSALVTSIWVAMQSRILGTWRALGFLLLAHVLLQGWLQWQWSLWATPYRALNGVSALLAMDTFAALIAVSALLLIHRDASVIALAIVWLGCPLGLLASMARYSTDAQLDNLPLRDSTILLTAMCLLGFFAIGGGIAFVAHLVRLLYLELAAKA